MFVSETFNPAVTARVSASLPETRLANTKIRLFLIEDSPVQAEMFELYFQERGYVITIATEGLPGLALLRDQLATAKEIPDLIVLDYWLPDQNGIEVCRQIRQERHFKDVPIMIFSGKNELAHKLEAYKAGADFYVVKTESGFKTLELLIRTLHFSSTAAKLNSLTTRPNS